MPFVESRAMDERMRFIATLLEGEAMSLACDLFGISRKTGYKWLSRYRAEGATGLKDRPSAPHEHGRAMDVVVRQRLLSLRAERMHWGPRKLLARLCEEEPELPWPAASTVSELLRREGLSQPRRRGRHTPPNPSPLRQAVKANDVWCADFKGWVRARDGQRCDPLTVSDAWSRYLLLGRLVRRPDGKHVRAAFEDVFSEYGLPLVIRTDNGPPFASVGAGGLSQLAVWWLKLGIRPERIEPGKPQQNGRHERMHRTMKQEAMTPPAATAAAQQDALDRFRQGYNQDRPHEALGQVPPARLYQPSPRRPDGLLREPVYDDDRIVRRVRNTGQIKWRGNLIYISEALIGEKIALHQDWHGLWQASFFDIPLGTICLHTRNLRRPSAGRAPQKIKSVT